MLVDFPEAAQRAEIDLLQIGVRLAAHLHPGGNGGVNQAIESLQIQLLFLQNGDLHAAADVYPHHIGRHPAMQSHGGADGAALARMGIGHDADAGIRQIVLATHGSDLFPRGFINRIDKHLGGVVGAGDLQHGSLSFVFYCYATMSR